MMRQVFDQQGRPVAIDRELGRGGEGSVFAISGHTDYVAKVYHQPAAAEKAQKLALMIGLSSDSLRQFAAWPVASLHTVTGGPTIGLIMPKVTRPTEIHELYSPAHRKVEFPTSDWRFLVRTAFNCAAAFESLHAQGIVIGDVNQGNVLVARDATVKLIDCDSFQIKGNETIYKCKVGVAHFTPPELASYEAIRTPNHDNFGLAVMIFHLLFMGRHPFSGRFSGPGDMPLEQAIRESRFAYGQNAKRYQMAPPPSCLSLQDLPRELSNMFEGAFADSNSSHQRPTATQWGNALRNLEGGLIKCSLDEGHFHYHGRQCPWCRIVQEGGPNFFISVSFKAAEARSANFNIHKIWFEIQAVSGPKERFTPAVRPPASALVQRPLSNVVDTTKSLRTAIASIAGGGVFLTLLSYFLPNIAIFSIPLTLVLSVWWIALWIMRPIRQEIRRRKAELHRRKSDLELATQNFSFVAEKHAQTFADRRQQLSEAKARYENLNSLRETEFNQLQAHARERQLDDFLERCFISSTQFRGVGPARKATLESYGIETAADVSYARVIAVPGFGTTLTAELVAWRYHKESAFRFNPAIGVPASAIQALKMKYVQLRSQIETLLEAAPSQLMRFANAGHSELGRLDEHLVQLELAVRQAELELQLAQTG